MVRQGGTQGRVSVDFKAINVSAEYGKDYIIRVYENSTKNEMAKNEAAFPLMQMVGENASINISEPDSGLSAPAQPEPTEEENPGEGGAAEKFYGQRTISKGRLS